MRPMYSTAGEHPPLLETYETVIAGLVLAAVWFAWYLARERYRLTSRQVAELAAYLAMASTAAYSAIYLLATRRSRREKQWPHPPLRIPTKKDQRCTHVAWQNNSVVLGYDVHGKPWYWPDRVRVMQGIVLGMT